MQSIVKNKNEEDKFTTEFKHQRIKQDELTQEERKRLYGADLQYSYLKAD
jgi:hypothetical protein